MGYAVVAYCGYNVPLQSDIKVKDMSVHLKNFILKERMNYYKFLI